MALAAKKKSQKGLGKGLGRGLDALLGDAPAAKAPASGGAGKQELPIEHLAPNDDQPRRVFDKDAIEDLAASIRARGLLQPILVRPRDDGTYEIVAGERRWRAAQKARLHNVPVIIRDLTDEETAEIALIENIQRVDLNPIEEATAYHRLADVYGRTQDQIAKAVGKSRSHVANIMRLMNLPPKARDALTAGDLTMGHARALLGAPDPDRACGEVLKNGWSVRETEAFVKQSTDKARTEAPRGEAKGGAPSKAAGGQKDADTRALERDLASILGLEVAIDHSRKGSGSVTVSYLTLDQLDDICRRLMGSGV